MLADKYLYFFENEAAWNPSIFLEILEKAWYTDIIQKQSAKKDEKICL